IIVIISSLFYTDSNYYKFFSSCVLLILSTTRNKYVAVFLHIFSNIFKSILMLQFIRFINIIIPCIIQKTASTCQFLKNLFFCFNSIQDKNYCVLFPTFSQMLMYIYIRLQNTRISYTLVYKRCQSTTTISV